MKKRYRILSLLMAATIAFTSLDVSVYAADLQNINNEEITQEENLGSSYNQGNDNGDITNTDNTDPVPTPVVEPSSTPEVPEGGNTDDPSDPADSSDPADPDDPADPSGNENESGDPENTEGEEGLDEELLDEELLDEELEEEEEDEDELIVTFERFRPVNTDYKLALDSLKELFPTKIVAYTNKDNEVEFEITDWNDLDNYDKLLGRYYFEPVFESDYEFDEGVVIPNLAVKVKDESEGAKGYVDFDVQKASADENSVAYENLKLPSENSDSYYNAFESGMVPEVRDQGQEGACWAFSTMAAIEANLIKQNMASRDDIDLSELQLAYFTTHGYDDPKDCRDSDTYTIGNTSVGYLDNGGNSTIASQALLNKVGVVEEVYAPYSKGSSYTLDDSYAVSKDFAEVTDAIKVDISNVKAVQNAIKKYGAAVASIYATQEEEDYLETTKENGTVVSEKQVGVRYSATHNSYYSSASLNSNHSVAIVGWDDSFPKENFHEDYQPESDGAWLIRNSWGLDGYGFRGYFWMSYCDRSLLKGETVTVYSATTDMYDNVYSYASGVQGGYYSPNTTGSLMTAEVEYSVKAGESVEAVTVEVDNTNSSVSVEVTDGKTTSTGTLHNESKGIYTIKLDNPIPVTSDSDIKVKYTIQASADEKPHILYEGSLSNYGDIKLSHNVSCDKGFLLNGYQRVDSDARVKLLTNNTGIVEKGTLEVTNTRVFDYAGTTHQIELADGSVTTNPSDITWSVVDENKATVDENGLITVGNQHGKTVVIGRYTDSQGYDYQVSVLVVVKAYKIDYVLGDGVYKTSLPTSYYPGDSTGCTLPETQYSAYHPVAKNGYRFAGWYSDADLSTRVTSASLVDMTGDITLYPKWEIANARIVFYEPLSDGSGYKDTTRYITYVNTTKTPFTIPASGTYDPNSYAPNGKKFDYWSLDSEGNEPVTTITEDNASFVPKKYSYGYVVSASDIALYPQYKDLDSSEVQFYATGGTVSISSKSYPFNKAFGNLPVPTRKGYSFAGWYSAKTGGIEYNEVTVATEANYTMYAHWTACSYNVTYDANGGTVGTAGKTVTYNSTYGTLPTPKRAGYTFKGWRLNSEDGETIQDLSTVKIDADHTLVATWTAKSYTVYFRSNGGTSVSSRSVTYGAAYGTLQQPTRAGYDFKGWHLGSVDGELITADSIVNSAATIYLYASWEPKTYTITFRPNGGTCDIETMTVAYNNAYGELPVPTRAGYKFNGWFANTSNTYTQYTATTKHTSYNDIAMYAQWTALQYTVTYDANGGTVSVTGKKVTYDSSYSSLANPSREGYTFKNWHLNAADGPVVNSGTIVSIAANHTLVAEWAAKPVTVSFNSNGSKYGTAISCTVGNAYGELPTPTMTGYDFVAWHIGSTTGTVVTSDTIVSQRSAHTLYASWKAKSYTVTFDAKGGVVSPETKTVTYNGTFGTLPTATKEGYTFVGWYDVNGINQYTNNMKVVNATDITMYAKWAGKSYSVAFNTNGGSNVASRTYMFGSTYESLPTPTRKGYEFTGWHLGSLNGKAVTEESVVEVAASHTLYATWSPLSFTVTFDANGGITDADTKTVTYDAVYGDMPEAEKEGFVFDGWFTSANGGTKVSATTKVAILDDQTLYAHWIAEDTKTIFYNGLGTAGAGVQYKTVVIGRAYGELLQDVVPGYEFIGWYSETLKRIVTSSDIVQNSRNTEYLTAKFRAIVNTINVTLDYADGRQQTVQQYSWTGGVNGDEIIRLSSAEGELPIPQYSELPIPTRDGYNFVAWHVGNVDSTIVKNGDEISLVNGDITLVAEWKEKDPVAAPIITIQDTSNPDLKRLAGVDEDTVGTNSVMNINTETDGAEIYYTKNATVADTGYTDANSASWTKYDADAGITITEDNSGTFYAVATKAGLKSSTVVSRSISVRDLDNDASLIANEEDRAEYLENKKNGIWVGGLGTTRVYNGAAYKLVPDVDFRVYDGVVLLHNKTDYTYALKNNVNAGNATLTITGRGNYKDTLQFTFVIDKKDFSEATFTLAKDCYQYTGKVIKAGVTVKDVRNGKTLTLGNNREYTLTYYDFDEETNSYVAANTKKTVSGKKAVVITGKGNYVGSETLYYRVADKNQTLNGASIKVNTKGIELGKDTQLTNDRLTVTVNRKVLTQEQLAACTITYKYLGTPANSDYSHGDDTYGDYIYSPGKYSITIVGDAGENEDSLFGTATATFSVGGGKAITTRMNKATFVSKVDYTGNVIQQNYKFYDGTDPLVEDIDYLVVRADGTNVGSYKDFVYGIGKYKGKLTYSYSIVGKPISTRTTKVDITSEAGDKIFEFKNDAYDLDAMNVVVTIDGVEVDADNYTVTLPKDMTNVGTKNITIVGKNAYTGKFVARKALTISQVDVATSDKVELVYDSDVDYVKGGVKQVPSVVFNGETLDAKTVSANFAFSYTNNTGRVAKNDSDVVKITVKPKKNFKASTALTPLEYTINKSDINETAITVNDMVYNTNANKVKSSVVLKDSSNNKALQNNVDYEKTIRYQYAEINSPITQKIKKEIVTVDRVVGDDIQSADIIPVGTKIKVTVTGKGNYYGTQTAVYRIISSQLSKVGVSVKKDSKLAAGYDYNGKERFISKSDLVVKNGKNELTSEDYDIVSYVNNVKKGKATITLRGKGNFGGTKTYTYNINAKSVSYSVTFDAVSPATGTMKKAVVNNSTYKLPKSTHKINTRQYVFDGWYYDEELTERAGAAGETIVLSEKIEPSETLNLYAKWKTK
jgi:uncharacterized repeat protein (TIGR02543 family)